MLPPTPHSTNTSQAAMREEGFSEVVTVEIDHRHRAVLGLKR